MTLFEFVVSVVGVLAWLAVMHFREKKGMEPWQFRRVQPNSSEHREDVWPGKDLYRGEYNPSLKSVELRKKH